MRVLAVIDSLAPGGAERLLAALARAAPYAGFELDVVSLNERPGAWRTTSWLQAHGVRPRRLDLKSLTDPAGLPALVRVVKESGCDLVHAHLTHAAILATSAAGIAGRPSVCTFHHVPSALPWKRRVKERLSVFAAGRSAAVIFVSAASLAGFGARYRRRANWIVVHNGIDVEEFRPRDATFPPGVEISIGTPTATIVGRMHAMKGHLQAIQAWPAVRAAIPEAKLLFVGSGAAQPALRASADALGIGDAVLFAGFRDDVPRLMQASSLILLPSERDAFPTTLLEAAGVGKPAIATLVGGIPEIVKHEETGLLVLPRDTTGLADALIRVLTDVELAKAMGDAARRRAEARFDVHHWARNLSTVYEAAIQRKTIERDLVECAV